MFCKSETIILLFTNFRRIHITQAVYEEIKNDYATEDGCGYNRDAYLKQQNIKSYFIILTPKVPESVRISLFFSSYNFLIL